MKRIYSLLLTALAMLAILPSAKAEDFEVTINWNNPGTLIVRSSISGDPLIAPEGASSYKHTEPGNIYLMPTEGYIITSVKDQNGEECKLGYTDYVGQYCGLSCFSSKNGFVYEVTTEKIEEIGTFDLNIINGEKKLSAYLMNDNDNKGLSTITRPALKAGEQSIPLSKYDKQMIVSLSNDVSSFYSVKRNGEDVESTTYAQIPVAVGDKIEIRVYETAPVVEECDVEVVFDEGSEGCLVSIFNKTLRKFHMADEVAANNGKFVFEKGHEVRFNFNEDYVINSIKLNGEEQNLPADKEPYETTIEGNSVFSFSASPRVYEDIETIAYITDVDGIVIRKGAFEEDEEIAFKDVTDLTEDVTFNYSNGKRFVIRKGTAKKVTIVVPRKTEKYFFDAKPGYWIEKAVLSKPSEPDCIEATGTAIFAQETPVYISVKKIENTAKAVVYYDGEESEARFYAKNSKMPDQIPVEGVESKILTPGYTEIAFDPSYHQSFSTGSYVVSPGNEILAYLDGIKLKYDENMAYSGIVLKNGSVLKVFSVPEGDEPSSCVVTFSITGGGNAAVTYDKIKAHDNLNLPIRSVGKTLVSIKPDEGTTLMVDGKDVELAADGTYEFTAKSTHTVSLTSTSGVDEIGAAENGEVKIYNLQGVELRGDFESLPAGIYIVNGKKVIKK